jgi:hypothetical protein
MDTSTERNAQESLLLRLPAEIRNRIWTHIVAIEKVYIGGEFMNDPKCVAPQLHLLRVCRQTYAEAALLPYSSNRFYFYSTAEMRSWLKQRASIQKLAIKLVDIFCSDCEDCPLRSFPDLRMVRVVCICNGKHITEPEEGLKVEAQLKEIWGNSTLNIQNIPG